MKKLLSATVCAAVMLCVSCGNSAVGNLESVFVGTSYAAEDTGHV